MGDFVTRRMAATDFYRSRRPGRGPAGRAELAGARAARAAPRPADPPPATENVGVPIRIFTPGDGPPRGVHLDIHGGGFYLDSAAHGDLRNRSLADRLRIAVVSVDYRLAPEHPWPAAPDDCETAARWLIEEAATRFGTSRLTIGGISAGATLAMVTLLRLRDAFAGAVLHFGTYDLSATTPAGRRIAGEYFIQAYAGHVTDRTDPDISPIFGSLTGLPPTLLVVGSDDILLDDNVAMAARLSDAGNDVDIRIHPGMPHGFTLHPTTSARAALDDIEAWLSARLTPEPRAVVEAFNDRINARDPAGLTALMTGDHTFVDPSGAAVTGREACAEAWRGFFAAFPDYRNVFETVVTDGDTVTVTGHSTCSEPALAGPARWTATVRDAEVARWQVTEP